MTRKLFLAIVFSGLFQPCVWAQEKPATSTAGMTNQELMKKETSEDRQSVHVSFDNVMGVVGALFGIVGVIAFLDQRRTNKENASVVALAEKYMQREGAEQTIARISDQLKELPQLARKAVLQEQSARIQTALAASYIEWKKIQDELGIATAGQLEPDLEKAITDRLLPAYMKQQQTQRGQQRIAVLGASIALFAGVIPEPLSWVAVTPLGYWLLRTIFELTALNGISGSTRHTIRWVCRIGLAMLILSLGAFAITTLFMISNARRDLFPRTLEWTSLCISFLLLLSFYPIDRTIMLWLSRYPLTESGDDLEIERSK